MKKLMLATALALSAVVSAHAQATRPNTGGDTLQDALRDPDPIHRDERLIAGANRRNNRPDINDGSVPLPIHRAASFEAKVAVVNTSAKKIKAVFWSATLTDPSTGELIRTYNVRTKAHIAPGGTKELKKMLFTPRAKVVTASAPLRRNSPAVADLKVAITGITYEDGSTSPTP